MHSGEVIYFDTERGTGFVAGDDGNRYVFDVSDLASERAATKGGKVAFEADGDRARRIRAQHAPALLADDSPPPATATGAAPAARSVPFGHFFYCVTKGYVRPRGRARRREFWSFVLVALIVMVLAGCTGFAVASALETDIPTGIGLGILGADLLLLPPFFSVLVRRLHDIGLTGWFALLGFIPSFGQLIILVFALLESQKHENRWGPVPAGVAAG
ncbi:MAG: DUF805 domain-containing protein [Rhizobiaceae bacterium]|nr:DUF805 domain-containing protein [Rhizobiaceae bacterium]